MVYKTQSLLLPKHENPVFVINADIQFIRFASNFESVSVPHAHRA